MAVVNAVKKKFQDGDIDLLNDTINCALLTNTHTTDIDAQEFWSDVNANEVSATGYTADGQALTGKTTSVDTAVDDATFDADNVTWTITGSMTARYAVVFKDTGTASTSPIITILDFGSDKSVTDGDFTVQWDTEGIVRFS